MKVNSIISSTYNVIINLVH